MSENSEQTLYEQVIGGSDITELTEESLLTQLFEDIRTSNITKSRKEHHKQYKLCVTYKRKQQLKLLNTNKMLTTCKQN